MDIVEGNLPPLSIILSLTDSSSALGWLFHLNFDEELHFYHTKISRKLARVLLDNNLGLYGQHLEGKRNQVADSLSRDHHIPDTKLTHLFETHFPDQIPKDFDISPLPPKISSYLDFIVLRLKDWKLSSPAPTET